ncbi:histidine triad nucleotide binding protein [Microcystis phage Mwe-JY05]
MSASTCVFCNIIAGRAPADVRWSTADSWAFTPLSPVTEGHLLIVPRLHVADAAEDPLLTARVMGDAARWAATLEKPFNLITSAGRAATQSIFHLHVHYIPRAADDLLMLPWGTLHGENPAEPHLCRQLRSVGKLWDDGPRTDPDARVGGPLAERLDELAERAAKWDADHPDSPS